MDPWPHSEAGRFHRGISLAVALVAGLILAAEAFRNHALPEMAVLFPTLVVALSAWRLHSAFRTSPANLPVPKTPPPTPISEEALRTGYRKSKGARG